MVAGGSIDVIDTVRQQGKTFRANTEPQSDRKPTTLDGHIKLGAKRKEHAMKIAQHDELQTSSQEKADRLIQELMGRLLVVVFILLLIAFSYFSFP